MSALGTHRGIEMIKSEAIALAKDKFNFELNNSNTHFSKVNAAKPVWWLEIPLSKINDPSLSEINLLVENNGQIDLLQVPTMFFKDHLSGFKVRDEKQVVCLELDIKSFRNMVGAEKADFNKFVK